MFSSNRLVCVETFSPSCCFLPLSKMLINVIHVFVLMWSVKLGLCFSSLQLPQLRLGSDNSLWIFFLKHSGSSVSSNPKCNSWELCHYGMLAASVSKYSFVCLYVSRGENPWSGSQLLNSQMRKDFSFCILLANPNSLLHCNCVYTFCSEI